MTLLIWILLVATSGLIVRQLVHRMGRGVLIEIAIGVGGTLIAGWLFSLLDTQGTSAISQENILVDVMGIAAVMLLFNRHFKSVRDM